MSGRDKRRHQRHDLDLPVRIFKSGSRRADRMVFEASVRTCDLSAGGMFVASTFFLKEHLEIEVELALPELDKTVQARAEIVRVATDERRGPTGFAIRFVELVGDSEIYLRAFLAKGDIFTFVRENVPGLFPKVSERQYLRFVELLVRWELTREADEQKSA